MNNNRTDNEIFEELPFTNTPFMDISQIDEGFEKYSKETEEANNYYDTIMRWYGCIW